MKKENRELSVEVKSVYEELGYKNHKEMETKMGRADLIHHTPPVSKKGGFASWMTPLN